MKTKSEWLVLRKQAAVDLGSSDDKHQKVHLLLVVRFLKTALANAKGDWSKAYGELKAVGHGFGMNASQFNQWLDRKEDGGVAEDVIKDLVI